MSLPRSVKLLALGFAASGTVHLVKPEFYEPIMPGWVPAHRVSRRDTPCGRPPTTTTETVA